MARWCRRPSCDLPSRLARRFLNTIVDDLFAFVIKMPILHRLAVFRDDLVFLVYIYQRWIYRVDKSRVNEFGFSDAPPPGAGNDAPAALAGAAEDPASLADAAPSGPSQRIEGSVRIAVQNPRILAAYSGRHVVSLPAPASSRSGLNPDGACCRGRPFGGTLQVDHKGAPPWCQLTPRIYRVHPRPARRQRLRRHSRHHQSRPRIGDASHGIAES